MIAITKESSSLIPIEKKKISFSKLVKITPRIVECHNFSCLGKKYSQRKKFLKIDEILVSFLQVNSSYCEISIRCPYCRNLIVSFGLVGFNYKAEGKLPDLDWQKIIFQIRNEWRKNVRQPSQKIILDYCLEKISIPREKISQRLD